MTTDALPPRSYSLVLPPGWVRLPVREGSREAVRDLLEGMFRDVPRDKAAPFREQARDALEAQLDAARGTGGLDLYLPVDPVAGRPLAASFVVSHVAASQAAPDDSALPAVLATLLQEAGGGGEPAEVAGRPGVRLDRLVAAGPEQVEAGLDRSMRHVDYVVQVPGDAGWLVLAFSTAALTGDDAPTLPGEDIRFDDLLVELFDAIVTTVRWRQA